MRHAMRTFVVILVATASLVSTSAAAQEILVGVMESGRMRALDVFPSTVAVNFPATAVGATSNEPCYYVCFVTGGSQTCNYPGVVAVSRQVAPPFRAFNFEKAHVSNPTCDGAAASPGISLAAGEYLLMDFSFSPTAPGTFSDSQIFALTPQNSPTESFVFALSGSTPVATPTILSFAATPETVRSGQPVTLSWSTQNATSVVISNVGSQPASGTVTVNPTQTTTYTLTAMSGAQTVTASVTVTVLTAPLVVISSFPNGMLQQQGGPPATTTYTVSNAGGEAISIVMFQSGNFFSQSPASFLLAPGQSQVVTITASSQTAGVFEGTSSPRGGSGQQQPLSVPIRLLTAAAPSGPVVARPNTNRVDVSAPSGQSPTGSVNFTNSGSSTLNGLLASDVPWLIPESGIITIAPGATRTINLTIDRNQRTDSESQIGSAAGNLSLNFLTTTLGKTGVLDTTTPSVSLVSVVDTVKLPVTNQPPTAIPAGQIALFVPGVGHVTGSVGTFLSDVSILNPPGNRPISDIRFFYTPTSTSATQQSATLPSVGSVSVALADVVKTVFGNDAQVGSLQIRSIDASKLLVSTNIFNSSNPAGTYGTAIPTFRSDRAAAAGERVVLTGLTKTATSHTNLFIQETSGSEVVVQTEFLNASGQSVGTSTDTVGAFRLLQLNDIVPAGAVSAIMTNSGGTGRFLSYATPVDRASGDNWSVVDWTRQYGYAGTEAVVIPVAGVVRGANNTFFRTDMAIMNSGTSSASGTLRYISRDGVVVDRGVSLGARQTNVVSDVIGSTFNITTDTVGYLIFTPTTGSFVVTSRTYTTVAGQPATFGTGVPTIAASGAMRAGALRPIGNLDDAARSTIIAARPATFRTNFALMETAGGTVNVRVTLKFSYPAGSKVQAVGSAFKDYTLSPNQFLLINGIATEILGASRDSIGDLRGLEAHFQVLSGNGALAVFTSSIDNGTGDSILRTE